MKGFYLQGFKRIGIPLAGSGSGSHHCVLGVSVGVVVVFPVAGEFV